MNEYESRWHEERIFEERVRGLLPMVVALLVGLAIAGSILAWDEIVTTGVILGALVIAAACFKPEWALLVITILAPLAILTQGTGNNPDPWLPSIIPGTGITPITLVVIILFIGAWVQSMSTAKPAVEASSVDKVLLLYLAWSGLSLVVSFMRWPHLENKAAGEWLAMACGYVMYWVVRRRWRSEKLAIGAVWVVLAMVVFESAYVMKQALNPDLNLGAYSEKLKYAITGTFPEGNSNDIAAYLSAYCMVALGLFLAMRVSVWRWPALAAFVAGAIATFYTYSRGAYIALIVGALAIILYKHKRYLVPAVVIVGLLPAVLPASVMERINTSGDDSAENRKEFWKNGISLMLTNPLGVGWRGYAQNEAARGQTIKDPHSQFVLVAAEQGIVGISLFIFLLVAAGNEAVKAVKRAKTPFVQGLGIGLFGALIAFSVNNAFGTRMIWFYSVQHFFLLLGILMVLSRKLPGETVVVVEEAPAKTPKAISPWRYRPYV